MSNYILNIETSTKACSAALFNSGKLISFKESNTANFSENILILSYRKKRITAQFKYFDITYGSDYLGDSISYGSDIYADYNNRSSDFGIDMYNGNKTEVDFMKFNIGYILNPMTNLKLEFSLTHRNQTSESYNQTTNYYSFSLISDLFNYYYDF